MAKPQSTDRLAWRRALVPELSFCSRNHHRACPGQSDYINDPPETCQRPDEDRILWSSHPVASTRGVALGDRMVGALRSRPAATANLINPTDQPPRREQRPAVEHHGPCHRAPQQPRETPSPNNIGGSRLSRSGRLRVTAVLIDRRGNSPGSPPKQTVAVKVPLTGDLRRRTVS